MRKQYQNIGAQIINLEKNKNVDPSTILRSCFDEKTYLDLITPYSDLIAIGRNGVGKHVYPDSVDFGLCIELNRIDYAICNYLHVLIGSFEKLIKNFLMHKYCSKMKSSGDKKTKDFSWVANYCRDEQVFDLLKLNEVFAGGAAVSADFSTIERRRRTLRLIAGLGDADSRNIMVEHYKSKYGSVPMFVAIHSLSLGQLLTLFGMLPQEDKNELVCLFNGKPSTKRYSDSYIEKFEKDAIRIQVIRNIINHYEPIFPFLENTANATFESLVALLKKLNAYYKRTITYPVYSFSVTKNCRSSGAYSLSFHRKIARIIAILA